MSQLFCQSAGYVKENIKVGGKTYQPAFYPRKISTLIFNLLKSGSNSTLVDCLWFDSPIF